jgi:hypothetical protein
VSVPTAAGRYVGFILWSVFAAAVMLAAGFQPTRRLGGEDAIPAMIAGVAIGFLGAALAGLVIVMSRPSTPAERLQAVFGAMGVRFAVAVALGAMAVLSNAVSRTPLLLWLAISYVALLPLEVRLAVASQ